MRWPSPEARRRFRRHWIDDPLAGLRLTAAHEGLRLLPSDTVSRVGARLGPMLAPRFNRRVDARIREGLRAIRPDLATDQGTLDAAATQVWSSVASTYAEFSVLDRLWSQGRVQVEGAEHISPEALAGRPLIVAGVHIGNWELIPVTVAHLGHHIADVYQPPRNRFEQRIAARSRARAGDRVRAERPDFRFDLIAPAPDAGARLFRASRDGAALVIYADESVGNRVRAPVFGGVPSTEGNLGRIARLARLADARVVPAYVTRLAGGARFTIRFLPPVPMQRTAAAKADLRADVAALNAVLATVVRENLTQWYMLVDFAPQLMR